LHFFTLRDTPHFTLRRTPLNEGSSRRRNICEKHTRDTQLYPRRDSNSQSQQADGRRPTPSTARSPGSAF